MIENLSHLSVIRQVLARHGFTFSKGLGQNFLVNPTVCPRMAEEANAASGWGILEIGPGIGVLTRELCLRAEKVVSVEIDTRLMPVLAETVGKFENLKIINQDVMKTDLHALVSTSFAGLHVGVAANLPYYITSPILMKLLEERLPVESITVMVQKEAAARICAAPGTREAGAISLAVRYYSEPEILFPVSRGSFMPSPAVDSCVIRLQVHKQPPVALRSEEAFFRTVRAAFCQRRKTLHNALSAGLSLSKDAVGTQMAAVDIPPGSRGEALTLAQFAALSDVLAPLLGLC